MNISNLIKQHVYHQPDNMAVICGDDGREFTWAQLDRIVNKLGNALKYLGVRRGDVVALYLPNSPEFLFAYFAATRIGAVALPFNILFRTEEIAYILENSRARILVGQSFEVENYFASERDRFPYIEKVITVGEPVAGCLDMYALIEDASDELEMVDCMPDELGALVYTSGTSGHPKGAMLSHGNLEAMGKLSSIALHINDRDTLLTGAPFCHICYVLSTLGPFNVGAGIVTLKRFNPERALELIEKHRVTHFSGVPTMYIFMLNCYDPAKHNISTLRMAHCAGAPMPVEHIERIEETFGVGFVELYGTTETCSTITYNRLGHKKIGSIGQPAYGVQVKVVDEDGNEVAPGEIGEFIVKGPGIFRGYWEMPEATKEAFFGDWYRTGDLGKCDEDGYLYILDRKKEMIVSGGYNVYPRELEEIIYQHPKVMEAAVLGEKDPVRNEVPKAYIALKENETMTEDELIEFCSKRMASYKVPRYIEFLPELPKSPNGKILKRMLKSS